MNEIWKPIKDYEGLYEISNLGNVKSLERYAYTRNKYGYMKRIVKEKMLKPSISSKGYLKVTLSNNNNKIFSVHRLVAETFIPNSNNLPQVNHIDGNKLNNNMENLEWCTNKENQAHAIKNGLKDIETITKRIVDFNKKNRIRPNKAIEKTKRIRTGLMNFNELLDNNNVVINSIDKVLAYIEELEKLPNKIRDKIKELEEELKAIQDKLSKNILFSESKFYSFSEYTEWRVEINQKIKDINSKLEVLKSIIGE